MEAVSLVEEKGILSSQKSMSMAVCSLLISSWAPRRSRPPRRPPWLPARTLCALAKVQRVRGVERGQAH